jgi:hypothetical protein
MKLTFKYRSNGGPVIIARMENGDDLQSVYVSYQGIASLTVRGSHYIAVGDYYEGHTPMEPGKIYQVTEVK